MEAKCIIQYCAGNDVVWINVSIDHDVTANCGPMVRLERDKNFPILARDKTSWWNSKAIFKCSVLFDGKIVHMLYWVVGEYKIMYLGLVTPLVVTVSLFTNQVINIMKHNYSCVV